MPNITWGTYYVGHVKTTVSGRTCMRYDLQSPHRHGYAFAKDHEIYCRNPFMGIPSEKVKDSGVLPLIPRDLGMLQYSLHGKHPNDNVDKSMLHVHLLPSSYHLRQCIFRCTG